MMNENDLNRLSRWGIPGWIAILSFLTFISVDVLFSHGNLKLFDDLGTFLTSFSQVPSVFIALIVAAAGIPFGFAIYQAYFFIRWNSPFSRDGLAPPFIVGRMEDLERTLRDIQPHELAGNDQWRKDWVEHELFQRDHGWRWRYIELFMTEIAQKIDAVGKGPSIFQRYRYLVDLMHILGASLFGIYFGFLFYFVFKLSKESINFLSYVAAIVFPLGLLIFFLDREDKAKKDFERPSSREKKDKTLPVADKKDDEEAYPIPAMTWLLFGKRLEIVHPGSLLLVFLAFTHLFCDSALFSSTNQKLDFLTEAAICLFVIVVWGWSKRKWTGIVIAELFILFLAIGGAYVLSLLIELQSWEYDWPFLTCGYIFLVANMVMLKNRQNTRDDVISIQYYTIRRYLTEQQSLASSQNRALEMKTPGNIFALLWAWFNSGKKHSKNYKVASK